MNWEMLQNSKETSTVGNHKFNYFELLRHT